MQMEEAKIVLRLYDLQMIQHFQEHIYNGTLDIDNIQVLNGLNFLQQFKIDSLSIKACKHIIPSFASETIKELRIEDCEISQLGDLQLPLLQVLSLRQNNLTTIYSLNNMLSITSLNLNQNHLHNIQVISSLFNLEQLDLSENEGIDISPIGNLPKIKILCVSSCQLTDISALSRLLSLEDLDVSLNVLPDLSPIQNLQNLTTLNISFTLQKNLLTLLPLKNLRTLNASYNRCLDISSISFFENLQHLDLTWTELQSTHFLNSLSLISLNLSCNRNLVLSTINMQQCYNDQQQFTNLTEIHLNQQFNSLQSTNTSLYSANNLQNSISTTKNQLIANQIHINTYGTNSNKQYLIPLQSSNIGCNEQSSKTNQNETNKFIILNQNQPRQTNLISLQSLNLVQTNYKGNLSQFANLSSLNVSNNLPNHIPLNKLIRSLILNQSRIVRFEMLPFQLQQLDLSQNGLVYVSLLRDLKVKKLNLSQNAIKNVIELRGCGAEELDLSSNCIVYVEPICQIEFKCLNIENNFVSKTDLKRYFNKVGYKTMHQKRPNQLDIMLAGRLRVIDESSIISDKVVKSGIRERISQQMERVENMMRIQYQRQVVFTHQVVNLLQRIQYEEQ
ncbi:leucine-rich_repeat domain-containing protein [Hexamita inflata]|uniref:Leucine-rich repeat domain-containing protein n=1 Tax=Hexamita inflata TaxID=28002 RepID=A0AA86Q7A7_9EUKA|nr:leucine-rich repeat domain-containing protein [Hexamita inflata]